jgi:RNA polymerase sigma-70 factor (ECF subfamily)
MLPNCLYIAKEADMQTVARKEGVLEETPADLVAQARSGDQQAFEELYRAHVGRVFALCLRVLADRPRAEETTQKIFIRAWMKLASLRGENSFGFWLHRLSMNMALNELKTFERRGLQVLNWDSASLRAVPGAWRSRNTPIDLERAIALLPPQARAVFVLHDVEGFRHEEIAADLGVAVGTCKAQLSRARKLLREALER